MTGNELLGRLKNKARIRANFIYHALFPAAKGDTIKKFQELYYDSNVFGGTWKSTKFLGIPTQKCPLDMLVYQEILFEEKPDLIIECGTAYGGGALYLASICELMGHGAVITIDITNMRVSPEHPRLTYLVGSSLAEHIVDQVRVRAQRAKKVMVILDSEHTEKHVKAELDIYHAFVTPGSYLIVEDTNVNGHPVNPEHGPGPMEALRGFLKEHPEFQSDLSREKHYLTFNPQGYLRKQG